jgi:hypothetical protein
MGATAIGHCVKSMKVRHCDHSSGGQQAHLKPAFPFGRWVVAGDSRVRTLICSALTDGSHFNSAMPDALAS